jgi:photosystem II stability/assembly factor-like uncharacterized protein
MKQLNLVATFLLMFIVSISVLNAQWKKLSFPLSTNIKGIDFIDDSTGWVTSYDIANLGKIYKTTNGGISWVEQYSGNFNPSRIQAINSNVVYAGDDFGSLIKTVNGGNSWQKNILLPNPYQFYFINENVGWYKNLWMNPTVFNKTTDGGATWVTLFQSTDQRYSDLKDIYFIDNQNGWAVGNYIALYTADGGLSWNEGNVDLYSYPLYSVCFIDKETGYAAGGTNIILKTTDGGKNWNYQEINSYLYAEGPYGPWNNFAYILRRIKILNADNAWCVGEGSVVYRKSVGNEIWSIVPTKLQTPYVLGINLNDIEVVDEDNIWVVGEQGTILKYIPGKSVHIISPNGGEKWYPKLSYPITWSANNLLHEKVRLEYSFDNGISWNSIIDSLDILLGAYNWTIPITPSLQCKMRITALSNYITDVSDSTFEIVNDPRKLILVYPKGGEKVRVNSDLVIKWEKNYSSSGMMRIDFCSGGCGSYSSYLNSIDVDINQEEYRWKTPGDEMQIPIIITDYQNSFIFDKCSEIRILYPPAIDISSPRGGERWQIDSLFQVKLSGRYVQKIKLEYSTNNGANWIQLGNIIQADSDNYFEKSISWKIPNSPSKECRMRASDYSDTSISSIGNTFEITNAKTLGFFPLQIGNKWYYRIINSSGTTNQIKMRKISKDTLWNDGKIMYQMDEYDLNNNRFGLTGRGIEFYRQDGRYIYTGGSYSNKLIDFSEPRREKILFSKKVYISSWSNSIAPFSYYAEYADSIGFNFYSSQGRPYWHDLVEYDLAGCVLDGVKYGDTFDEFPVNDDIGAKLSLQKNIIDFEGVTLGKSKDTTIILTNIGNQTLYLWNAQITNYRFQVLIPQYFVEQNQSIPLTLRFKPTTSSITYGDFIFKSNSISSPETLQVMGHGLSFDTTQPGNFKKTTFHLPKHSLDFGNVFLGRSCDSTLMLMNNGNDTVVIENIQLTNFLFQVQLPQLQILPSQSVPMSVRFTPNTLASVQGSILVLYNSIAGPETLTVSGMGINGALVICDKKTIDYGTTPIGTFKDDTVHIKNIGNELLYNSGKNLFPSEFTIIKGPPFSIPPDGTSEYVLRFTPAAIGIRTGLLIFSSSSIDNYLDTVYLKGIGKGMPRAELNIHNINFGTVVLGEYRDTIITLRNTGLDTLLAINIHSDCAQFTFVNKIVSELAPSDAQPLTIRFSPISISTYSSKLLVANLTTSDTILLRGIGISQGGLMPIGDVPSQLYLTQNFPNPFNPSTTIRFGIPAPKVVIITVYNTLGERISTLVNNFLQGGNYEISWTPTGLANGVYIYHLQAGGFSQAKKMLILK